METSELPDLPQIDDTPRDSQNNGLHVETIMNTTSTTIDKSTVGLNAKHKNTHDNEDGLSVETLPSNDTNNTSNTEKDSKNDTENGLHVETSPPTYTTNTTNIEKDNKTNCDNGLHVETLAMNDVNTTSIDKDNDHDHVNRPKETISEANTDDTNNGLPVKTVKKSENLQSQETVNTHQSNEMPSTTQDIDKTQEENYGLPVETPVTDTNQHEDSDSINDATLGLIMLRQNKTRSDTLLEKYDNSALLPVDAKMDYGVELTDDNNNSDNSNDTIVLQKEIADSICENSKGQEQPTTDTNPRSGLRVETNETNINKRDLNDEASGLTTKLSKLTVNTPKTRHVAPTTSAKLLNSSKTQTSMETTPVLPNKGKVVFHSYKLCRRATETEDPGTTGVSQNINEPENAENKVRHLNIPTGNATRPPLPDKYKI